jgi:GTP-binding protein
VVVIIGRPNVGKSSLFNRIIGKRKAIVDDIPGVTRDRNFDQAQWKGHHFIIVDTGGYLPQSSQKMEALVKEQVEVATQEADLLLFLVDASTGALGLDLEIVEIIRKSGKKRLLVVNKVDTEHQEDQVPQFYRFGLGDPIPVSATTGRNCGELLDLIARELPRQDREEQEPEALRIAIVGRPNVGKSSFVNALLGEERLIIDEQPGTTRDSTDTIFSYQDQKVVLIDTAGLRRRSKIKDRIEFYCTLRTIRSLQRCKVAILLIDAVEGLTSQDIKILQQAIRFGKGVVLAVNKWDLLEKDTHTAEQITQYIQKKIASLRYTPVIFTSALTCQRIHKSITLALEVYQNWNRKISTSQLNRVLQELKKMGLSQHKDFKLSYVTQTSVQPPGFLFFVSRPDLIKENYRRYLENKLRKEFDFTGTPIRLTFRRK